MPGWVQGALPRMYTVQSTGCAPVVRAFAERRRGMRAVGRSVDRRQRPPGARRRSAGG